MDPCRSNPCRSRVNCIFLKSSAANTLPLHLTGAPWHSTERANGRKNKTLFNFFSGSHYLRHQTADNKKNPTWIFILYKRSFKTTLRTPPIQSKPVCFRVVFEYLYLNGMMSFLTLSRSWFKRENWTQAGNRIFNSPGHFYAQNLE